MKPLDAEAAILVRRSREAQGLPPHVEDTRVLGQVAAVLVTAAHTGSEARAASSRAAS